MSVNRLLIISILALLLCFWVGFRISIGQVPKNQSNLTNDSVSISTLILDTNIVENVENRKENVVKIDSKEQIDSIVAKFENDTLNQMNVSFLLLELQVEQPEMVLRQALLESAYFKSRNCKLNNNLFGMGVATRRPTYGYYTSTSRYARFDSWAHSVGDYKLRQLALPIKDAESFERYLKRTNYASDKKYYLKLMNMRMSEKVLGIF